VTAPQPLSAAEFKAELELGAYAWPGGYQRRFIMADGESLCFACAEAEAEEIRQAIEDSELHSDWRAVACDIHWEGAAEQCSNCNKAIESAYGDPDASGDPEEPSAERFKRPADNDESGACRHCGRDNSGEAADSPCADECPQHWEAMGIPNPEFD
jgi:hypothetical protein